MKKRSIAGALTLALVLSLCAVTVAAGEQPAQTTETAETAQTLPDSPAGPDAQTEAQAGATAADALDVLLQQDAVGTVSFANVERRMRGNNLTILTLDQTIETLKDIDYEKMEKDLRDAVNGIASSQFATIQMSGFEPMGSSLVLSSLQQQYDALKEQFDAVRKGELQEDNEGLIRQLKNGQDQVVLAGEATYLALVELETQEGALERQLAALNRTVEELELRYQLGQISALQLQQAKSGRTQLASGLETLRMNLRNLKLQFEVLLGAEQTGNIQPGSVPEVTEQELSAMDVEKDLLAAKEKSYDLYDAAKKLEDAQEEYKDAVKEHNANENKPEFRAAKRTWQAAQYTYSDAVQSYELKFRTLYAQVQDYKQISDAAKVALACEQASCEAAELKYQQGTISQNALLDARDSLQTAKEKASSAASDLFSSYNTYRWAVEHGVLN